MAPSLIILLTLIILSFHLKPAAAQIDQNRPGANSWDKKAMIAVGDNHGGPNFSPAKPSTLEADVTDPVYLYDPNLGAALREALGKSAGDITAADMATLKNLDARGKGISSLTGLEYAINLSMLWLDGNQINDISPLANLTNLQYLDLGGNQINDISPLANLISLQWLNLGVNQIGSIPIISNLTSLQWLALYDNQISDISPLADLTNLLWLDLGSNQISDIAALANLTSLHWLALYDNQISGIPALTRLTNLYYLRLDRNQVVDISPLVTNSNEGGLGNGDIISLQHNYLDLMVGSNDLTQIQTLVDRGVRLFYQPQRRLVEQHELPVDFPDSNLETAIRVALGLPSGAITRGDLAGLNDLYASNRGITDLTGLEYAIYLKNLALVGNQISDISALTRLTNLNYLGLDSNQIIDISPLVTNSDEGGLGNSDFVHLQHNYLDLTVGSQNQTNIQTLIDRGVGLFYQPQRRQVEQQELQVDFPDSNLETAIRVALGLPSGAITRGDMAGLTGLYASQRGITDLTGLEFAIYLQDLALVGNQISNISALANLTSLQWLSLAYNQIMDISPLVINSGNGGLGSGDRVDLRYNPMDLSGGSQAMADINSLTNSGVIVYSGEVPPPIGPPGGGGGVPVVPPVPAFPSVTAVMAFIELPIPLIVFEDAILEAAISQAVGKAIGTITIADMALLTELDAGQQGIQDLTGLEYATNLHNLHLEGNQINDISALVTNSNNGGLGNGDNVYLQNNYLDLKEGSQTMADLQTLLDKGMQLDYQPQKRVVENPELPVEFPDPNLEAAVRAALGKNSGAVTRGDMSQLASLDADSKGITDLTGLEYAIYLEDLRLWNNQITDLSPLAGLTSLREVDLDGNQISDIAPLAGLVNLNILHLGWNILGGSALENIAQWFPQLESLHYAGNGVSDISALANLTSLQYLKLGMSQISDISSLAVLTSLRDLNLNENQITDISPLAGLTSLRTINLSSNQVTDISALTGLTSMLFLGLDRNRIDDISALANLTSLQDLYLRDNQISDLSSLANLNNLKLLYLDDNHFTNIGPLVTNSQNGGLGAGDYVNLNNNYLDLTPGSQALAVIQLLLDNGVVVDYTSQLRPRGTISGIVTDAAGTPLGGVSVEADGMRVETNPEGGYTLELPFGTYKVFAPSVDRWGINDSDWARVRYPSEITIDATHPNAVDVDFTLQPGGSIAGRITDEAGDGVPNTRVWAEANIGTWVIRSSATTNASGYYTLRGLRSGEYKVGAEAEGMVKMYYPGTQDWSSAQVLTVAAPDDIKGIDWIINGQVYLYFADPNLEAAVRAALGKPTGDISSGDMAALTSLVADHREISDLSGLEYAINLENLNLGYNQTSNIDTLAGLTALQSLDMGRNQISDISPLAGLTNLRSLLLGANQIIDFSPLVNLTDLQTLSLGGNQIGDLANIAAVLANKTNLQQLYLWDNQLSDISLLADMTGLREIVLGNNHITDFTPLANLTQLQKLRISNNEISDLTALQNLTDLQQLLIDHNNINDITPLTNLTNLQELNLSDNHITSISPLVQNGGLSTGDYVNLKNNYLDLSPDSQTMIDIQLLLNNGVAVDYTPQLQSIGTISGTVTDAAGTHLDGISVEAGGKDVETDPDGSYTIELPYGTYMVFAPSRERWGTNDGDWAREKYSTDVTIDVIHPDVTGIDFTLKPGGSISGRITDSSGDGVPNAHVWAELRIGADSWVKVSNATTDNGGYYILRGLANGEYKVGTEIEGVDPIYYPGTQDRGNAQVMIVTAYDNLADINWEIAVLVHFSDPNLEAVVRDALGKPSGAISATDMATLDYLNADNKGISDLTGLEYAVNLFHLRLGDNRIRSLSPLTNLTKIQFLNLSFNQISDLTPLANMTKLGSLDLTLNQISNISSLANLIDIQYLHLEGNQISDISVLANMTNLVKLWLKYNKISDISPLMNLTNLTELWLWDNQINDIAALAGLTSLQYLNLGNNQLDDVSALANMTSLQYLNLSYNQVSDIYILANFTALRYLILRYNQIADISPIANLRDLWILYLGNNNLSQTDFEHIIQWFPELGELDFGGNGVYDISSLTGMISLSYLDLEDSEISDITSLATLTKLWYLNLNSNQISDISSLANLTDLKHLFLTDNNISNISPLVANSDNGGLDNGDNVEVQNNYLDFTEETIMDIKTLQSRGVDIIYKPQRKAVANQVSVAIDNIVNARPQSGLDQADIVYETAVAPGITRYLAVFYLNKAVDKIGPVRSAREHLVGLAAGHGGGFAHAGGDSYSLAVLPAIPVINLDEIYGSGSYFYRTIDRATPHNLYTNTSLMQQGLTASGQPLVEPEDPFPRDGMAGGTAAAAATVRFPGQSQDTVFQLNAAGQNYQRFVDGQPDLMDNNASVTAANVVVLYTDHRQEYQSNLGEWTIKARVEGTGDALLYRDGKVWNGQWTRADRDAKFEFSVDGNPMQFAPGNVWVLITNIPGQQTVYFPDHRLDASVRNALGKPRWDLTTADLNGLTYLNASGRSIQDLTGLNRAVNLQYLDLSDNDISDISPLLNAGFGSGVTIDLRSNYMDLSDSGTMDTILALIADGVTVLYQPQLGGVSGQLQLQARTAQPGLMTALDIAGGSSGGPAVPAPIPGGGGGVPPTPAVSTPMPWKAVILYSNSAGGPAYSTRADTYGNFNLPRVEAGSYTLVTSYPGYLAATRQVTIDAAATTDLGSVHLLTGDLDSDHKIGAQDLKLLARSYGKGLASATWNDRQADFNADGRVDLYDIALLARNYEQSALPGTGGDSSLAQALAAGRLYTLGIVEGDLDGKLRPGATITRAEFAVIASILAGLKDEVGQYKKVQSPFSDVQDNAWYSYWIKAAAAYGLLKGYPDGTFNPDGGVTNAEVITVLLRLLGYNDNLPGNWPSDYVTKAAELGLTANLALDITAPAERADVFVMVNNFLDQYKVGYDQENDNFVESDERLVEELLGL